MNSVFYLTNHADLSDNRFYSSKIKVSHGVFGEDIWNYEEDFFPEDITLEEIQDLYPKCLFGGILPDGNRNIKLRLLGHSLRIRDKIVKASDIFKVRVYSNLQRGGFSLQKYGLVIGYADTLLMRDVKVVINKSGRDKAIQTKRRNVHAFLEGLCYTSTLSTLCSNLPKKINYRPKRGFTVNGEVRAHFDCVKMSRGEAFEIKLT